MTAPPEVSDEIRKVYADHVAEINKREVSSSENFDKAVLTFSSAGLALSVGFLKDFVPIQSATAPWTLYWSWALFTAATCATIISFLVSSQALEAQKGHAYAYYMQGDDDALKRGNAWDRGTRVLNNTSGGSFLIAMVLSVVFISINLETGSAMKDSNTQHSDSSAELLKKGLTVPTMQLVQRPPAQPASGQTTPASTPASTPARK
ncbi:MAG: hypothetical protein IH627_12135 [Rubrivivax sp.]|nr:hypothetical protein [Rubrivivax sp.]